MIFGIGTDIIRQERLERSLGQFGNRFAERILMPQELADFRKNRNPARFLAMRFAAKEAIVKALGTGFAHGIWVRDVGVAHNAWGKPEVIFSPRGQRRCAELGAGQCFVSLADEGGFVVANAMALKA